MKIQEKTVDALVMAAISDMDTPDGMTHVDDFIDGTSKEYYARWFFALHRFPAALAGVFAQYIRKYELYCTYEGRRWRVTGASRTGDIWLKFVEAAPPGTNEYDEEGWIGPHYDKRGVYVNQCTDWSDKP